MTLSERERRLNIGIAGKRRVELIVTPPQRNPNPHHRNQCVQEQHSGCLVSERPKAVHLWLEDPVGDGRRAGDSEEPSDRTIEGPGILPVGYFQFCEAPDRPGLQRGYLP